MLAGLARSLEPTFAVRTVAIRLVLGCAAAAQRYPLSIGKGIAVAILVYDLDGTTHAVGAVCSYFDLNVGHFVLLKFD